MQKKLEMVEYNLKISSLTKNINFKREEEMLTKIGHSKSVNVSEVKKHGQGGFAVLFTSQGKEPKHESWICFPRSYLKHGKLNRNSFKWWGSFKSPTWFKKVSPGIPILLIVSELAEILEKQLRKIF